MPPNHRRSRRQPKRRRPRCHTVHRGRSVARAAALYNRCDVISRRISDAPRLVSSGRAGQAGPHARREDRSQALSRARPRDQLAARLRGTARCARDADQSSNADRGDRRRPTGRADRPGAHPSRRTGHGRRDARADADRRGVAPGAVPRRADAATGRVLQQAARLRDGGPVPDPGSDARDGRLGHGRDRGAQEVGRRDPRAHQAGQPDRGPRRSAHRERGASRRPHLHGVASTAS